MNPRVHLQGRRLRELLPTREASVRFLPSMRPHMLLQVLLPSKLLITNRTRHQILPSMRPHMLLQVSGRRELLPTGQTREFRASVSRHVRLKLRRIITHPIAHVALVRLFAAVLAHVHCQLGGVRELLIAYLAGDFLTGVLAHVHIQMGGLCERFRTDGATVGALASVRFDVRIEDVGAGEFFAARDTAEGFFACMGAHVDF